MLINTWPQDSRKTSIYLAVICCSALLHINVVLHDLGEYDIRLVVSIFRKRKTIEAFINYVVARPGGIRFSFGGVFSFKEKQKQQNTIKAIMKSVVASPRGVRYSFGGAFFEKKI